MPERRTLANDAADWALARSVQVAGVAGVVALAAYKHGVV
jgi:hypothetical protein